MTEFDHRLTRQSQYCPCPAHRYARGEVIRRGGRKIRQRLLSTEEKAAIAALGFWAVTMVALVVHAAQGSGM